MLDKLLGLYLYHITGYQLLAGPFFHTLRTLERAYQQA